MYAVFTGTAIAPSRSVAKNVTTCSGPFSSRLATRSPRPTPMPASAAASRPACSSMRRAEYASPMKSRYAPSGSEASRAASSALIVVRTGPVINLTLA